MAASALQSCSFLRPNTSSRCTPSKSATLASVLKNGGSELNQDLRDQYEEECPSNCEFLRWKHICIYTSCTSPPPPFLHTTHNRYSVSPSLSSLSDSVKQGLRDSLTSSGALNAIVLRFKMELVYIFNACLRFSMTSMDLTTIKNRPQPFLQVIFVHCRQFRCVFSLLLRLGA